MTLKISCGLTAFRLLTLVELTLSAMVLPRPPSSPNEIPGETINGDKGKFRNEKTLYSLVQHNTNVEKPNTDGYRLLEIELGGTEEVDETNLRGLVRAMLNSEEQHRDFKTQRETYPNPEVIPNSIVGVRDIGFSQNYRIHPFMGEPEEKRTLLRPPNDPSDDEKYYYLKNTRPKVDVNVRGHSGSFTSDAIVPETLNHQISIIRPPGTHQQTKSILDKRIRRPKKYQRPAATSRENVSDVNNDDNLSSRRIYGTDEYEPRPDRANDESTTENMSVTSSELPKQIPAPPSRLPNRLLVAQTTPVQKYSVRRTDILPGYNYGEA